MVPNIELVIVLTLGGNGWLVEVIAVNWESLTLLVKFGFIKSDSLLILIMLVFYSCYNLSAKKH
jgi:hypothetical protein